MGGYLSFFLMLFLGSDVIVSKASVMKQDGWEGNGMKEIELPTGSERSPSAEGIEMKGNSAAINKVSLTKDAPKPTANEPNNIQETSISRRNIRKANQVSSNNEKELLAKPRTEDKQVDPKEDQRLRRTTSLTDKADDVEISQTIQEGSQPYRPQFPDCPEFGICYSEDFIQPTNKCCLGKGGFGSVYLAKYNPKKTLVALKKFSTSRVQEWESAIQEEERIHHELEHKFIVKHYCTYTSGTKVYFVLEYVHGGNLTYRRTIQRELFDEKRVAKIIGQLVVAARYLHQRHIIHRDIKPGNVLLDRNDDVKLIDFGLARDDNNDTVTKYAGTYKWAAPEVLDSGENKPYGRSSDYYSIGILAYYIWMGATPYNIGVDETPESLFQTLKSNGFAIPSTENPKIDELVAKLTEPNPATRWASVYENFVSFKSLAIFSSFQWPEDKQ